MYLILGSPADPCCAQVEQALRNHGSDVRILDNLFSEPQSFTWRFGGGSRNASIIGCPPGWEANSSEIEGVLVRNNGLSAITGWSEEDTRYISTEMQAALLAWLWSLPGVVVNRLPAWLFLMPRPSLLQWIPYLTRAGLLVPTSVISNSIDRLRDWRAHHADGAILAPLSTHEHFELNNNAEWDGVMRLAGHAPVALQQPHGKPHLLCVVGQSVIWNPPHDALPAQLRAIEAAVLRFAQTVGLNFVQLALADLSAPVSSDSVCAVVAVDLHVDLTAFENAQQQQIVQALASLLIGEQLCNPAAPGPESAGVVALAGGAQ